MKRSTGVNRLLERRFIVKDPYTKTKPTRPTFDHQFAKAMGEPDYDFPEESTLNRKPAAI